MRILYNITRVLIVLSLIVIVFTLYLLNNQNDLLSVQNSTLVEQRLDEQDLDESIKNMEHLHLLKEVERYYENN